MFWESFYTTASGEKSRAKALCSRGTEEKNKAISFFSARFLSSSWRCVIVSIIGFLFRVREKCLGTELKCIALVKAGICVGQRLLPFVACFEAIAIFLWFYAGQGKDCSSRGICCCEHKFFNVLLYVLNEKKTIGKVGLIAVGTASTFCVCGN